MAGSYKHIVKDDGSFHGVDSLDDLGDAYESLEECYFMIHWLSDSNGELIEKARKAFYSKYDNENEKLELSLKIREGLRNT